MKKYLYVGIFLGVCSLGFQACRSKAPDKTVKAEAVVTGLLQVDELLADAEKWKGQWVEVEGICTHICAHGGGKIFLMGSDDTKTIRIEAGERIGKFKQETVNHVVRVKGYLVEERVDEAYLTRWEEQVKNRTTEKHGETEAGCSSEQKARGEVPVNTAPQRIENFRKRIAARKEKEGKDYLSFYHVEAERYQIL